MWRLLILAAVAAAAQAQLPPPGMRCPQRTLVISELGGNQANAKQFAQEHFHYMAGLMKSGKVIAAGPTDDKHTAVILFATSDWNEAEELLKKEPFHRAHVLAVKSHSVWNACEAAP